MTILFIIAAGILIAVPLALVLYCAVVDGAARNRYQDAIVAEWMERRTNASH